MTGSGKRRQGGYNPGKACAGSMRRPGDALDKPIADTTHAPMLLERIVRSASALLALDTPNMAETLAHLRMLALRSGTSAYVWEPESGLGSLRESGLHVPGSKRITDALRYVAQSMHFGIYFFTAFGDLLKPADTALLRRIARVEVGIDRKLVLVANRVDLPDELDGLYERIAAEASKPTRLHLRDGRWVE
jgi:hypothetical protein